jgi:integrase
MARPAASRRPRGAIRQRGRSFQVIVYAGLDPLTGRKLYLRESTTDGAEAQRILRRLTAQVDDGRHAKTNASFRTAMEAWLRTHEIAETTRASYEMYARVDLYPAFGDEPIGKVSPRLLEEFYAALRRCSTRCDGRPSIEHRVDGPHECRTVKHRRRPGPPPATCHLPPATRRTTAPTSDTPEPAAEPGRRLILVGVGAGPLRLRRGPSNVC